MYMYDQKGWPEFQWNQEKIRDLLIQLRHLQGRLIGGMQSIGFHFSDAVVLQTLTQDVVKSSEIEGEILDKTVVRSSVARHLGMDIGATLPVDRNVEGVVTMLLDATQKYNEPLTSERLFSWHANLFPTGHSGLNKIRTGMWRKGPVDVVSGRAGKEVVHFEAPPADRLDREMKRFLHWCNQETTLDPVLKAALSHLWFVTIHPFEDGNGRISRAIGDLMLARSEKSAQRFYSLSAQIQLERKDYYNILEKTQKGNLHITSWIEWFLSCLERAIKKALTTLDILVQKSKYWEQLADLVLNERQRKIINLMLEGFEGKLTTSKWAKIAKCSQDTAYRDILDLIKREILTKNQEGGRSTSYSLKDLQKIFD